MKILVLGVTGMLGNAVFRQLSGYKQYQVTGTMRNASGLQYFSESTHPHLICNLDVLDQDSLITVFDSIRPDVVINCVGLIKQHTEAGSPLFALPVNSMLPHRLSKLCSFADIRLIHISTDCVFSGRKGMYVESDISDADDLYGKSKFIGELHSLHNAITLRTSIIGHELNGSYALIEWFLSQTEQVKGYTNAVFSGLPTVELARVIGDYVIPMSELHGLYHVSAEPIDKFSLLRLVAKVYGKNIEIIPDEQVCIDRSLDSTRFREATNYMPPPWSELIRMMYKLR